VGKYYVPVELRQKIIDSVAKNIIDDEFNALLNLRDEHKQGLFGNIDVKITRKEQKNNWAKVSGSIEFKNPAYLNVYGSRSDTVTHHNFDLVHQEYEDIKDTESRLRVAVISTLMEQYFDDRKFNELEIINNVNIINAPEDRRKEVLTETLALIQNLNTEWNLKVFLSGLLNISCGESIFKINSSHLPRTDTISDWKVGDFQHIYYWQYVLLETIRAEIAMDEKYYSPFLQILIYAKSILSENSIYMHYYNALYDSSQTLDRIVLAHLRGEAISVLMEQYFDDRKFNEQEIINRINKNVSAPEYKKKEVLSEAIALARAIGEKRVPDVFSRGVLDISCCNDIFDIHSQMLSQINTDAWTDDDLRKISEWRNALLKSVKNVVFTHHWEKDDILIRLLIYAKAIMTETAEYMPYYYALYHTDKLKNVK
jgi:hypothetical protein